MFKYKLVAIVAMVMLTLVGSNVSAQDAGTRQDAGAQVPVTQASVAPAPETCDSAARSVAIATSTDTRGIHQAPLRGQNASESTRLRAACGDTTRAEAAYQTALVQQRTICRPVQVTPTTTTPVVHGAPVCGRGAVRVGNHCECRQQTIAPMANLAGAQAPPIELQTQLYSTYRRSIETRNGVRTVVIREISFCPMVGADTDSMEEGVNSLVHRSIIVDLQDAVRGLRGQTFTICEHPDPNGTASHDCDDYARWLREQLRLHGARLSSVEHDIERFESWMTSVDNHLVEIDHRLDGLEGILGGLGGRVGLGVAGVFHTQGEPHIGFGLALGLDFRVPRSSWAVYFDAGIGGGFTNGTGPSWAMDASIGARVMANDNVSFQFGPAVRNHWISWQDTRFPGSDNILWMVGGRAQVNFHLDRFFLLSLGVDLGGGQQTVFTNQRQERATGLIVAPFLTLQIPLANPFVPARRNASAPAQSPTAFLSRGPANDNAVPEFRSAASF